MRYCTVRIPLLLLGFSALGFQTVTATAQAKKQVNNASDLPRFTYPVRGSASELVQSDETTFNAFAGKVQADLDSVFRDYDVHDQATLRQMRGAKLNLQELAGEYKTALASISQIRALEEKPSAKLTAYLNDQAWLDAAIETGSISSSEFRKLFASHYRQLLEALPWQIVQDNIREQLRDSQIDTKAGALGWIKTEYDPAVRTSGVLDNRQAWDLIAARRFFPT